MPHADVLARLEAAALVPGRLRAMMTATTEDALMLRQHLAECEACRREMDAWQAVDESLAAATPDTLTAPAEARGRILSNVLATGVARGPDRVLGTAAAAAAASADAAAADLTADVGFATSTPARAAALPPTPLVTPTPPAMSVPGDAPNVGRVWRTATGQPSPSPMPVADVSTPLSSPVAKGAVVPSVAAGPAVPGSPPVSGVSDTTGSADATRRRGLRLLPGAAAADGLGVRVFLAVAAAAVFLFALGAALGGPLGLTGPTTVQDTAARAELERVLGRMADVLQSPGVNVAPLTDESGEPAGAVLLALPDQNLLAVATRALPALPAGERYVCILERDTGFGIERFQVGYMRFAADATAEGDVAYWLGPLGDDVPADAGAPGDRFLVFREGATDDPPLLTATF